jgi:hypothetical protein
LKLTSHPGSASQKASEGAERKMDEVRPSFLVISVVVDVFFFSPSLLEAIQIGAETRKAKDDLQNKPKK